VEETNSPPGDISPEVFMEGCWQKKSLLVRQAFADYISHN
jgi:ribosomal protein L16 Arg81 hydroxylase